MTRMKSKKRFVHEKLSKHPEMLQREWKPPNLPNREGKLKSHTETVSRCHERANQKKRTRVTKSCQESTGRPSSLIEIVHRQQQRLHRRPRMRVETCCQRHRMMHHRNRFDGA